MKKLLNLVMLSNAIPPRYLGGYFLATVMLVIKSLAASAVTFTNDTTISFDNTNFDAQEIVMGTNPRAADTDGDGLSDGREANVTILILEPLAEGGCGLLVLTERGGPRRSRGERHDPHP